MPKPRSDGRLTTFLRSRRRGLYKFGAVVLAPLSLGLGAAALSSPQSGAATNPITIENANPGTSIPNTDPATVGQIEGYASAQSVNAGGTIGIHVSSSLGPVDLQVYRLGWYGGAKSRKMFSVNGVAATAQPKPAPDGFGRVEAGWPVSYNLATASNWASGIYVVGLFKAGAAVPTGLVTFVVRNDTSASSFLYVLPMNTYEAYNGWGGKSLYGYNSGGVAAKKVSFDRPFDSGSGAGLLFEGDAYMINFLEQEGYDVAYASSSDLNDNPGLLSNHKAFLSSFHDEYWSAGMRTNLENAVSAGKHAAFFGANSVYWQMRFEPSSDGRANRTMVGYKESAAQDPVQGATTTGRWRDAPINRPENALLGSQYEGDFAYGQSAPWVVANASHWMYNGTGLANGDQIPKLVGYEWDRVFDNGQTPAGVVTLSNSTPQPGALQQATIHQKGGALVFNASTIYWPLLLANANWGIDSRVQQMTRNLLNAMIDPAGPPATTLPPTTTIPANTDTVVTTWDFEDGTTQGWGTWYGTGTVSPTTTGAHGGTRALPRNSRWVFGDCRSVPRPDTGPDVHVQGVPPQRRADVCLRARAVHHAGRNVSGPRRQHGRQHRPFRSVEDSLRDIRHAGNSDYRAVGHQRRRPTNGVRRRHRDHAGFGRNNHDHRRCDHHDHRRCDHHDHRRCDHDNHRRCDHDNHRRCDHDDHHAAGSNHHHAGRFRHVLRQLLHQLGQWSGLRCTNPGHQLRGTGLELDPHLDLAE